MELGAVDWLLRYSRYLGLGAWVKLDRLNPGASGLPPRQLVLCHFVLHVSVDTLALQDLGYLLTTFSVSLEPGDSRSQVLAMELIFHNLQVCHPIDFLLLHLVGKAYELRSY